jgi:8-oxo-dGTP pyrophosphatase MutT (NUDIX family)
MSKNISQHISKYPNAFYRVSLKAVIRDESGRVLVNKEQDSKSWNLPGGGWDHGETEMEALARELYEEIGYEDSFEAKIIGTTVFWLEPKQAWLLWIVYDVKPKSLNFSVGADSSEIAYIDPKTLKGATSFEEKWIYENL